MLLVTEMVPSTWSDNGDDSPPYSPRLSEVHCIWRDNLLLNTDLLLFQELFAVQPARMHISVLPLLCDLNRREAVEIIKVKPIKVP